MAPFLTATDTTPKLSEEELGAFLRREGIHESQLEEWRAKATEAATGALKAPHAKRSERTPEARRIKELERELLRKDKALAEVAALLALKKKVQEIWGDEDDDTPHEERDMILGLVDEAVAAGCPPGEGVRAARHRRSHAAALEKPGHRRGRPCRAASRRPRTS